MDVFVHIAEIFFILHKCLPWNFLIHIPVQPPSFILLFHCRVLSFVLFLFPEFPFSFSLQLIRSAFWRFLFFPGFAFSHAFLYNHLIRTEVIDMPHPTIEQLMIQNLQKQNDALQKRCQTLEELLDTKEALILNQNKLILNLQALCDKQQTLLDELSNPQ